MSGVPQTGGISGQNLIQALLGAGAPSPAKAAAAGPSGTGSSASSAADARSSGGGFSLTSNYAAVTAATADGPAPSGALKQTLGG